MSESKTHLNWQRKAWDWYFINSTISSNRLDLALEFLSLEGLWKLHYWNNNSKGLIIFWSIEIAQKDARKWKDSQVKLKEVCKVV